MKKLNLLLALGLLTLISVPAFSTAPAALPGDNIIMKTEAVDANTIKVLLANLERERTSLTIESLTGKTYYSDNIVKHRGYLLKLDVEDLPNGRYLLKVKQKDEMISQIIVVRDNTILISKVNS